ncbi:hypothetical protein [Terrabacter sp. 2RAF25]|uniref:hypothetical protein n=1 Tax=Terrabacter sp. 2RAF25 TaxID=3232998 RepID=UPI003F9D3A39
MNTRIVATTLVALGALAVPAVARAVPAPDPRPAAHVGTVSTPLRSLQQEYRLATTAQKHAIHNEISLLVNVGSAAR